MKKIRDYIISFFKPSIITFYINTDKETAADKIEEFIKGNASSFFTDIKGTFVSHNKFEFFLVSMAYTSGVRYSSKFQGEIINNNQGKNLINATLKPAPVLYFLLVIACFDLIAQFIYLLTKDAGTTDIMAGFVGAFLIGAVPFFIYHISNASTIKRFGSFLKKDGLL